MPATKAGWRPGNEVTSYDCIVEKRKKNGAMVQDKAGVGIFFQDQYVLVLGLQLPKGHVPSLKLEMQLPFAIQ